MKQWFLNGTQYVLYSDVKLKKYLIISVFSQIIPASKAIIIRRNNCDACAVKWVELLSESNCFHKIKSSPKLSSVPSGSTSTYTNKMKFYTIPDACPTKYFMNSLWANMIQTSRILNWGCRKNGGLRKGESPKKIPKWDI